MPRIHSMFVVSLSIFAAALQARGESVTNPSKVYITEFCSDTGNNEKFEFVEFTNSGSVAVNMSGWSEDDSNAQPNQPGHSLSAFGSMAPGESGIFTEASASSFRSYWNLPASVKVIGPSTNDNLSTGGDTITLYDGLGKLVDRLDYGSGVGDAGVTHATRTAPPSALGQNNSSLWGNSALGDSYGSYTAAQGLAHVIGNPGKYLPATTAVPAPSLSASLLCGALVTLIFGTSRRVKRIY